MEFSTALREGDEGTILSLVDADSTLLEMENYHGDRPLAVAAWRGQLGVARLLIERCANINATGGYGYTALHYATEEAAEELVALLLRKGAHANIRNQYGVTPLMSACINDNLGVVKMLVQHMWGQGLDDGDDDGWTALHYAAYWGREEMLRCLLLAGADPSITDNEGRTPRASAEENQHDERIGEGRVRSVDIFQVRPLAC
jgi:ankyrin repeat protein